jgi:hypothetical protein
MILFNMWKGWKKNESRGEQKEDRILVDHAEDGIHISHPTNL